MICCGFVIFRDICVQTPLLRNFILKLQVVLLHPLLSANPLCYVVSSVIASAEVTDNVISNNTA